MTQYSDSKVWSLAKASMLLKNLLKTYMLSPLPDLPNQTLGVRPNNSVLTGPPGVSDTFKPETINIVFCKQMRYNGRKIHREGYFFLELEKLDCKVVEYQHYFFAC